MRSNRLKQLWQQGQTATNAFLTIPNSWTAEVMAHAGYDSLTIDMQHGLADFQTTLGMLQAISTTDTVPLIRLPWNDPAVIMHVLDAGAMGVICPTLYTAEEVKAFVGACRYPPLGYRSMGPIRANVYAGEDYVAKAREEVLAIAMIETAEAAENIEAFAAVPGLDGLLIGPYDLSLSLGLSRIADIHDPTLCKVMDKVLSVCSKNNLMTAIFSASLNDAIELSQMGFSIICHGSDSAFLQTGARENAKKLKEGLSPK